MLSTLDKDQILSFGFQLCSFVYSVALIIKLIGNKLFINGVISIFLLAAMSHCVVQMILFMNNLDGANTLDTSITINIISISSLGVMIISFGAIIDLRNRILINNKGVLFLSRIIIIAAVLSCIGYGIAVLAGWSIRYIFGGMIGMCAGISDLISSIYLLLYYQKYYFKSRSIMKLLRFQMIYRRNWIYFVVFLEMMGMLSVAIIALNIYPITIQSFLKIIVLFQMKTMIDFVKFDKVRNEIIIGDQTLHMLEDPQY